MELSWARTSPVPSCDEEGARVARETAWVARPKFPDSPNVASTSFPKARDTMVPRGALRLMLPPGEPAWDCPRGCERGNQRRAREGPSMIGNVAASWAIHAR